MKIRRPDLGKVLKSIYDARSRYLHVGEPMYLSRPMRGGEKWDAEPSLGRGLAERVETDLGA